MDKAALSKANTLQHEIDEYINELNIWDRINSGSRLAYEDDRINTYHGIGSRGSRMSDGLFNSFKQSVINELKLKIIKAEKEIEEL